MIWNEDRTEVYVRQSWLGDAIECAERGRFKSIRPDLDTTTGDQAASGTATHTAIELVLDGSIAPTYPNIEAAAKHAAFELCDTEVIEWDKLRGPAELAEQAAMCAAVWLRDIYPQVPKGGQCEVHFKIPNVLTIHYDDGAYNVSVGITGTADYVVPPSFWYDDPDSNDAPVSVGGEIWDWKGLSIDTPLPTPTGWTTMGDVQVGDHLVGVDGLPTEVVGKSKVKRVDCYRVSFRDGSSIVTDDEHLWEVRVKGERQVVKTPDLADLPSQSWIEAPSPLKLAEVDLSIDPYLLGLWLGDGSSAGGLMHSSAEDHPHVERAFNDVGYRTTTATRPTAMVTRVHGFTADLRHLGVLGHKSVPAAYLRSSLDQRLALLQGLMDTDGNYNTARRQCCFDNTNLALADAVGELVASMGWSYSVYNGLPSMPGAKPYRRITFTPTDHNPFRLPRKRNLVAPASTKSRRRYISSVQRTVTIPTQCVAVDAPDHLYLAGEKMIPTHNTVSRAGKGSKWEQWKVQRYDHQSAIYDLAAVMGGFGESFKPERFAFGVVDKKTMKGQLIPVHRTIYHHAWVLNKIERFVRLAVEYGDEKPWPVTEDSWLCSPKYCPAYELCRGRFIGEHEDSRATL